MRARFMCAAGVVFAALLLTSEAAFTCRTAPFSVVSSDKFLDGVSCDCCDCSDEPGSTTLSRADCAVDEAALASAALRKDRIHRQTRKIKRETIADLVKESTQQMRARTSHLEQDLKRAESREASMQNRVRSERQSDYAAALERAAQSLSDSDIRKMIVQLAQSQNTSSAEWVCDAAVRAGVSHVDRTDAVYFGSRSGKGVDLLNALGVNDVARDVLIRVWRAILLHPNGTIMVNNTAAWKDTLPPHWNNTAPPEAPEAARARAAHAAAKLEENAYQSVERSLENERRMFNYGPNRSFAYFDGRCFDIPKPLKGEPGWRIERPSTLCMYRYARYNKFTAAIRDLVSIPNATPVMLFKSDDLPAACKEKGGHETRVGFECFTEDVVLYTEAASRCAVDVIIGTPLGC